MDSFYSLTIVTSIRFCSDISALHSFRTSSISAFSLSISAWWSFFIASSRRLLAFFKFWGYRVDYSNDSVLVTAGICIGVGIAITFYNLNFAIRKKAADIRDQKEIRLVRICFDDDFAHLLY